jgi:hypothetical protein
MTEPDPSVDLMRMINGYQVSQALHVAASLGVADQPAAMDQWSSSCRHLRP